MKQHLFGYLASYLYLFGVILAVTLVQKLTHIQTELSRKIIHILIGTTWLILYHFFWPDWQILIVPVSFILINGLSYKYKLFSAIERTDAGENHLGTIYFSIAMTLLLALALIFPKTILASGLAVACLCFGDGFAAICGTLARHPIAITRHKTVQGTIGCMLAALFGVLFFGWLMGMTIPVSCAVLLAAATGILELVGHGLDNFSIVFGIYALASVLILNGVIG